LKNTTKVKILDSAIVAAAKLADRYIQGRKLPDKAIDLLDEACSMLRIKLSEMPEDLKSLESKIKSLRDQINLLGQFGKVTEMDRIKEELSKLESEYEERKKEMA